MVAISPYQKFVAASYNTLFNPSVERRIGIYSTDNWSLAAMLSLGDDNENRRATAMAFSPDGMNLAVDYSRTDKTGTIACLIGVLESNSNDKRISGEPASDARRKHSPCQSSNGDSSSHRRGLGSGGSWWMYPNGRIAPPGTGALTPRISAGLPTNSFSVESGDRIGSVGGFPRRFPRCRISVAWAPHLKPPRFCRRIGRTALLESRLTKTSPICTTV